MATTQTVPGGGTILKGFEGVINSVLINTSTDIALALSGKEQAWGRRTLWETARSGDEIWFYQSVLVWMMFVRGNAPLRIRIGGSELAESCRSVSGDAVTIAWAMQLVAGLCGISTTLDKNAFPPDSSWEDALPGKRVAVLRFN